MKRRNFFVLMLGNLAWLLLPGCGRNTRSESKTAASATASRTASTQGDNPALIAYEKENQAQIAAAVQQAAKERRLAEAVAHTKTYRRLLSYNPEWAKFIKENLSTFFALRREAAQSPTKTVPCTFCSAGGELGFCLLCNSTGKCPTCHGTGTLENNSICPTCQGNGKCFLCHGSGKMPCPFCEDGEVYADQPTPPDEIPIA